MRTSATRRDSGVGKNTFAAFFAIVAAWFALVFTGRWPQPLYDFVAGSLRYSTRVHGYLALTVAAWFAAFAVGVRRIGGTGVAAEVTPLDRDPQPA